MRSKIAVILLFLIIGSSIAGASFNETHPLDGEDVPDKVSENVRVNIDPGNLTWDIGRFNKTRGRLTVTGPANTTGQFWVRKTVTYDGVGYKLDPDRIAIFVDGEYRSVTETSANGTKWLVFSIEFTGQPQDLIYVRDSAVVNKSELGPREQSLDTSYNKTEEVNASRFTSAMVGSSSLRVSNRSGISSVEVTNRSEQVHIVVNSTKNESKIFWVQKSVLVDQFSVTELNNIALFLEDEQVPYEIRSKNGTEWVVFEVDHFSTRTARFASITGGGVQETFFNLSLFGIPVWTFGAAFLGIVGMFVYFHFDSKAEDIEWH